MMQKSMTLGLLAMIAWGTACDEGERADNDERPEDAAEVDAENPQEDLEDPEDREGPQDGGTEQEDAGPAAMPDGSSQADAAQSAENQEPPSGPARFRIVYAEKRSFEDETWFWSREVHESGVGKARALHRFRQSEPQPMPGTYRLSSDGKRFAYGAQRLTSNSAGVLLGPVEAHVVDASMSEPAPRVFPLGSQAASFLTFAEDALKLAYANPTRQLQVLNLSDGTTRSVPTTAQVLGIDSLVSQGGFVLKLLGAKAAWMTFDAMQPLYLADAGGPYGYAIASKSAGLLAYTNTQDASFGDTNLQSLDSDRSVLDITGDSPSFFSMTNDGKLLVAVTRIAGAIGERLELFDLSGVKAGGAPKRLGVLSERYDVWQAFTRGHRLVIRHRNADESFAFFTFDLDANRYPQEPIALAAGCATHAFSLNDEGSAYVLSCATKDGEVVSIERVGGGPSTPVARCSNVGTSVCSAHVTHTFGNEFFHTLSPDGVTSTVRLVDSAGGQARTVLEEKNVELIGVAKL